MAAYIFHIKHIQYFCGSIHPSMNSMAVVVVLVLIPSCVHPSEAHSPVCGISQGLASHVQPVEAGQEEEEGAEGVEEGDGGVQEVAGQHGGQGKTQERGGQDHVEGRLDEESGEAGEDAEEGHDAEEGDGGPGGDRGEVEEARGDRLEQLGDVRGTTGVSTGVTIGLWGRLRRGRRSLVVTRTLTPGCRVCSGKGLAVLLLCPRSWWSGGLFLCRPSLLLGSRDGLQTKGTQEGDPWGGLLL